MTRLIAGLQPVREAIRAHGERLTQLLVEEGSSPQLAALVRFAEAQRVAVRLVSRAELDRAAKGGRHQGAIAFAPPLRMHRLDELLDSDASLLVILDEVQDPQNFGAVIRSSVAFGASGIVWPEHASAPLTAATFRASAGVIERAKLCRVGSLTSAIGDLHAAGFTTVALDAHAPGELSDCSLQGRVALVVGSEGKGIRKSVRRACLAAGRLPIRSDVDSLNASVALAVALYEVHQQRRSAL